MAEALKLVAGEDTLNTHRGIKVPDRYVDIGYRVQGQVFSSGLGIYRTQNPEPQSSAVVRHWKCLVCWYEARQKGVEGINLVGSLRLLHSRRNKRG